MQELKMNFNKLYTAEIKILFNIIPNLFIVGGAIRNTLLNYPITDIDLTSQELPDNIIKILKKNNINYNDKNKKFGTIIININNKNFEITSFRKDTYTNSRYPKIEFTPNITTDTKRRDFRLNAIYLDKNQNLIDITNGITDIKNKNLIFIKSPLISITEDPIRILRYFRLISEYNLNNIDSDTLNICLNNFDKTFSLTKQKFKTEFEKIITGKYKNIILDKFQEFDILNKSQKFIKK